MSRRRVLAMVLAVGATACGPDAAVWVRIEAPFLVPEEADAVHVTATRTADGELVYDLTHALAAQGVQFPVEFALTNDNPANTGPQALQITAEVLRQGALVEPWARATVPADVQDGRVTHAVVRICDCLP